MALHLLTPVKLPQPGNWYVDAAIVDGSMPLIPQDSFLAMLLGQHGMKDSAMVEKWRQLMFYRHDTRVRMQAVVYIDRDGEEQLGYRIPDVVRALCEFYPRALAQKKPVRTFGENAREVVYRFALGGIYVAIDSEAEGNVKFEEA